MKTLIISLTFAVILAAGCSKHEQTSASSATPGTATTTEMTPEQLGELGAAIQKQPEQAQRLLSERGLNEESFEEAIRRVSENADASKRYTEAYRKAST